MASPTETLLCEWALGQLGRPPSASWPDSAAEALRRIEAADFCPPPAVDYAVRVLTQGSKTNTADLGGQQAVVELEAKLRAEADKLAAGWFSFSLLIRRRRWDELFAQCESQPHLRMRLEALAPGFEVDAVGIDGAAGELARWVLELFVLRPGPRARRRRELLLEMEERMPLWDEAAQELQEKHPEIAELEPVFLEAILTRKLHEAKARSAKATLARSMKTYTTNSEGNRLWPLWVIAVVLATIGRIISTSTQSPSKPVWNPPQQVLPQPQAFPRQDDEIRKGIDAFLRDRLQREGKWILQDGKLVPAKTKALMPPWKKDTK